MSAKKSTKGSAAKAGTSLVLRVCGPTGESHGGFVWPLTIGAEVSAPDWIDNAECGNGLHGFLYGEGNFTSADHWKTAGAKWLVVEVVTTDLVILGDKCKFPRCIIRFVGSKSDAAAYLLENESRAKPELVIGASIEVGEKGFAHTGPLGTATAGYSGTATAGDSGTATAGDSGTATAGDSGTATAGYSGTATAGRYGTATAGRYGTATAGRYGTATAGRYGTATAGDSGTATAGDSGTATAGDSGTATAGDSGELRIRWYDHKKNRYRTAIAYVGENDIKENTPYRVNDYGEFVEVSA